MERVSGLWKKLNKKEAWAWVYSVIIVMFLVIGHDVTIDYSVNLLSFRVIGLIPVLTIVIYVITSILFAVFDKVSAKEAPLKTDKKSIFENKYFLFCLFFLSMMPVYLGTFPGTNTGDTYYEYVEFTEGTVSRSFPVLHTLLYSLAVITGEKLTGSTNIGVAMFTLGQIVLLSAVFTYIIRFFQKRNAKKGTTYFLIAAFIINPITQLYCKDSVRDTLFCYAVLVISFIIYISLFEVNILLKNKWRLAGIFAICLATIYLRAFAKLFYIIVIALLLLFVIFSKEQKKGRVLMAGFFASVLLISSVFDSLVVNKITQPVTNYPGISTSGIREYLCVPIEQLNYLCYSRQDIVSEEDIEILSEIMDRDILTGYYNPKCVDKIKYSFDNDKFKENPGRYLSVWLKYAKAIPGEYLNVLFTLNSEAWYPDTAFEGYFDLFGYNAYYQDGDDGVAWERSFIPAIRSLEKKIAREDSFQKIPVINLLFSPAFMLYIILLGFFYMISRKKAGAVILIPALILHMGFFIGPMICLRYFMASFWIAPVSLALCFSTFNKKEK